MALKFTTVALGVCSSFFFTVAAGAQIISPAPPFPVASIGVFQNGVWSLDMDGSHTWNAADEAHFFGVAGDQPVVFSAVNDCVHLTTDIEFADIGVRRDGDTWFETTNDLDYQIEDTVNSFHFGGPGIPLAWTNGVPVSYANGSWTVDANNNHAQDAHDFVMSPFGQPSDYPLFGSWRAGGQLSMGVFNSGTWWVDLNRSYSWDTGDAIYHFGSPGDIPVAIPYSDGIDRIGVFQNGVWSIDANGNHVWDGPNNGDALWNFGSPGDIPVVARGNWKSTFCPVIN